MRYLHDLLPKLDHSFEFGMSERAGSANLNHHQFGNSLERAEILRESEIATAFERGRQNVTLELQALHEAQLEELRTAEQLKLEELVRSLEMTKANEFTCLLETTLRELEQKMDSLLVTVVNPFIKKLVPASAMKELEIMVKSALSENVSYKLDVRGPQNLIESIKESLSSLKIEVVTEVTDSFEVQVRCDEFLLTTRMEEWLNKIDGKIDR